MNMKVYYTYEEALEIIEKFMIESGIRKYCENICKGECCKDCPNPCFKRGQRRLPCSVYICDWLRYLLPNSHALQYLDELIFDSLLEVMQRNPYYHPNEEVKEKFKILKSHLNVIKLFEVTKYKKITEYLISNKIKVYMKDEKELKKLKKILRSYIK